MICIYILVLGGPCDRSEGVEILHRHGMVTEISTRQTNVFLILMKKLFFFLNSFAILYKDKTMKRHRPI